MIKKVETLKQFYELMFKTKKIREKIVKGFFKKNKIDPRSVSLLKGSLSLLENIQHKNGKYHLSLLKEKTITMDLTYEIEELKKDIYFLEHSEEEFYSFLEKIHGESFSRIKNIEEALQKINFLNFITDRDGTINNYCGRYASSIQSIYNSIFLTRFASNYVENSVILTSAPLSNIGLIDVSINPKNVFTYAASKGREYRNRNGKRHNFPVEKTKQNKLDQLNHEITKMIKLPEYEIFSLVGSGFQLKFGQTTISRQDIYSSIPKKDSEEFLDKITKLVNIIDPDKIYFRIEDTGTDIEIILTVGDENISGSLKDFDKGDGIDFLDKELSLNISKGPNLICGDTGSDVPMVSASMKKTEDTCAIFVTEDSDLKNKVKKICPNSFFIDKEDHLVIILNNLSKRKKL